MKTLPIDAFYVDDELLSKTPQKLKPVAQDLVVTADTDDDGLLIGRVARLLDDEHAVPLVPLPEDYLACFVFFSEAGHSDIRSEGRIHTCSMLSSFYGCECQYLPKRCAERRAASRNALISPLNWPGWQA